MTMHLPADAIRDELLRQLRDAHRATNDPRFNRAALELLADEPARLERQRRIAERDDLLRKLAKTYGVPPGRPLVRDVLTEVGRYMASQWRFDGSKPECPYPADSRRGLMWAILKTGLAVPQERRMFDVLLGVGPSSSLES